MICTLAITIVINQQKNLFFINDKICIHVQTIDKLNSRNELKILQAFLKKTFNFNSRIAGYGVAIFQKITFTRYTCKRIRKALDLGFNRTGAKLSSEFFICRLFLQHVTISVWTLQKMLGRTPVQQLITTTVRGGFCLARHI